MDESDSLKSFSVKQVSEMTGIPQRTVRWLIQHGYLAAITPNGCSRGKRVMEVELRRWIDEREREATHEH